MEQLGRLFINFGLGAGGCQACETLSGLRGAWGSGCVSGACVALWVSVCVSGFPYVCGVCVSGCLGLGLGVPLSVVSVCLARGLPQECVCPSGSQGLSVSGSGCLS